LELTYSDLADGIRKINLLGRLDVEGATAIDLRFTALTAAQQSFVIVDLTGVEFLASLGISTLVRSAKAVRLRNGNLVLLSPRPNVAHVLTSMRIDQILPVYQTLEDAQTAVRGMPPGD
jgi:anti-sigma B factor antagonist